MRIRSEAYKRNQTQKQLARRRADPEKYREMGRNSEHKRRMKRYGVDAVWYEDQLIIQNNSCDICKESLIPGRTTHIDHNHTTGAVRGLLCNHCNYLIGNAKENKYRLLEAINYLERHNTCATS